MLAPHIVLYALLGTSLGFAIIELGVSAHVASFWTGTQSYYDPYSGVNYNVHVSTPPILNFLLFASIWTMVVAAAALVLPWFFSRKGAVTSKFNTILGVTFAAIYFMTQVFWLASFADIATSLGGGISPFGSLNALIAFAVLLWLLFLALFILTVLALCGVLVAEWPGYQSMRNSPAADASEQQEAGVSSPAHDVPMSTTPEAASASSTRDAKAFHNQPQPLSLSDRTSSPSALTAELYGGNIHHDEGHSGLS